jgi:hypothetical protein
MNGDSIRRVKNMTPFIALFIVALILISIPVGTLGLINKFREKQPGCSGDHDCVVYKGERITCPSCDLREFKAALAAGMNIPQSCPRRG